MSAMFIAAASEYIVGDEKVSWLEAETWCLEQGYHLASIHSAEENAAVSAACPDDKCWAGLQCIDGDQFEWRWSDGTDFDYDNWYTNEPNNEMNPTNEDCVEMYGADVGAEYNGFWNNHQCSELHYPICRVAEYIVGDEALTWLEAEAWCVEQGHHLASIHSAEENAAVLSLCPGEPGISNCWTGLNCIDGDNFEWTWSDGTDFDYDNWYPNEPNNEMNPTNEDCVEMYLSGPWNNKECKYLNYPICRVQNDLEPETAAHFVARGRAVHDSYWTNGVDAYCHSDDNDVSQYFSIDVNHDDISDKIRVSCCSADGTSGWRPTADCFDDDWSNPQSYQEAEAVCNNAGYRMCTLQEMLSDVTQGTGCWYDLAYNWVSDACTDPIDVNAAIAMSDGAAVVTEDIAGSDEGNTAVNYMETVYGVAIAVVVLSAVVLLAVFMAKRKKSAGKKAETAICDAVHVPELSPTDCVEMDTVEVATGKESGDGVEAARE